MKKIIITGATSFIGIRLIEKLVQKDVKIYAVVRPNTDKIQHLPQSRKIIIIQLDMQEYKLLSNKIQEQCDIMYALAWNGTRGSARLDAAKQEKNYKYSMELLQSACKLGCKRVISAGSQAEYGNIHGIIKEDSIPTPNTAYGKWKYQFYLDAYDYCKKNCISFKEPRFFSLYGKGDYSGTMIISVLGQMTKNLPCKLTKCIQKWDFLYIDDAVDAIIALGFNVCADGAYNIGSGDTRPLKSFIEEIHQITCSSSILEYGTVPYPETGMVSIVPDITKLKEEIHFIPKISFTKGITKILEDL